MNIWNECSAATPVDEPYVQDGHLTDRGIEVYTEGECWYLAWVLYQMTGWEPVIVSMDGDVCLWMHIMVRTPDGLLLDATGSNTKAQVMAEWKRAADHLHGLDGIAEAGYADLKDFLDWEGPISPLNMPAPMVERTEEVARTLLAGLLVQSLAEPNR